MKKPSKLPWKVLSISALAAALSLSIVVPSFALDGDIKDRTSSTPYQALTYRSNTAVRNTLINSIINSGDMFTFEFGGKDYEYSAFSAKVTSLLGTGLTPQQAKTQAASMLPPYVEQAVQSVSALKGAAKDTVTVTFKNALPATPAPAAADLAVTRTVNGTADTTALTASNIQLSADSKTVTFDVTSQVAAGPTAKTVKYSVAYKGASAVQDPTGFVVDAAPATLAVQSVSAVNDANVANGTSATGAIAQLPTTVNVTLSDGTTRTGIAATWAAPSNYNASIAGTYTFTGTLAAITGVDNSTNVKATANVIVADIAQTPTDINVSVHNAIPNLTAEESNKPLNNVVLLGDKATIQARVTDQNNHAVANQVVTFTINSAETYSDRHLPDGPDPDTHKYVASAAFGSGQKTITASTDANGIATADITAAVTSNELKSQKDILTDKYAATEVTYGVVAGGQANTGAVSFATFGKDKFGKDVDVNVDPYKGESPVIGHTLGLYPFSDEGTRSTLNGVHDIEYAVGQTVSGLNKDPDNTLKVTAKIDLNVYTSLVSTDIQGDKTLPLSYSLAGIKPNQTDVYTEANLVIPDRVNNATLHFNSMSISRGTQVTVFFVPAYIPADELPTQVDSNLDAQRINGHYQENGIWAKTYAVAANADSFVANDFALQIPKSCAKGQIYIVTQAPGQIDPATDIGYQVSSIDMNYGALADITKADVSSFVQWSKVPQINYTAPQPITGPEKAIFAAALGLLSETDLDVNWSYQYKAPVYPMVGDAVVQAVDGFGHVVKEWNVPTKNQILNGEPNQNDAYIIDWDAIRRDCHLVQPIPVAEDADFTTPAQATLDQDNGIAYINSTHTGPQEIKGTLNFPDVVPNTLINSLGLDVYSFAQWTPLPIHDDALEVKNLQYALSGQNVTLTAKVTDANGNLVQSVDHQVAFDIITGDNNIGEVSATGNIVKRCQVLNMLDADTVTGTQPADKHYRYYVQTNNDGTATLTISAPNVASVIAQATAYSYFNHATGEKTYYNVALSDAAGPVNASGKLTQINFGSLGLYYVPEQGQNQQSVDVAGHDVTISNPVEQDYKPTRDAAEIAAANSSAVVGNQQSFGILSQVVWPEDPVFNGVCVNNCAMQVQGLDSDPDVTGIPFTVTLMDGSVGSITQVSDSTDTTLDNKQINGGLTHWTALSDKAGQETVLVAPKNDATSWNNMEIMNGTTPIVEAGSGIVTPVNSLTIPIQWRVGMGAAVVSVPSSTANLGASVPIKVTVTDAKGNPIAGETVRFTLTRSTGGAAQLSDTVLQTNAQGEAISTLTNGQQNEQDGITVVVEDSVTGTTLPVTNGQQNIVWLAQIPSELLVTSAVPNTAVTPNTITLTFNSDIAPSTVLPDGSQFTVMDTGAHAPNSYAVKSAVVSKDTITLTLADSNAALAPEDTYSVTINKVVKAGSTYQVGDVYNNVVADGGSVSFTIPASSVTPAASTTQAPAAPAAPAADTTQTPAAPAAPAADTTQAPAANAAQTSGDVK